MANIFLTRDRNPERRRRALSLAAKEMQRLNPHISDPLEFGDIGLVWECFDPSLVEVADLENHKLVTIGRPIGADRDRMSDREARSLLPNWQGAPPAFDGYHIAAAFDATGSLQVSVDPLGLFPVYHTTIGDTVLIASATGLLRSHESFVPALDALGLAGLLVANNLVDGRTLCCGVRRLAAGHVLCAQPDAPPIERASYSIPISSAHYGDSFEECVRVLDDRLREACRRHIDPHSTRALALSGGLDSRLLAAMLTREGLAATAVTNGLPGDIEYRCAKRVAATLGMPQVLLRSPPDACDFVRDVEWDAPSSGPFFVFDRFISDLGATAPRIISGYLMDTIIGGPNIDWCYDAERRTQGYDTFFSALNRWGISPMRLQLLLRSDVFGDAVAQTQAGLQREFESVAETDLARAWLFELRNRGRYWIGSGVTRQARSAWPEIPHTDREILKFAGGVPMGMLAGRRLQMDLIQSLYPEIAQIPRDRNSWDMRALSPTARDLVRQALWRRFRALRMKLRLPHAEQRYYYRMFDINAPHWMEVRRRVEPYRESAHAIFNREELARIWPPVDVTWTQGHPIESGNGARLILSIAAWLGVSGARVGSA